MLKILLTGRSGFIGRNLMEYFTRMPNKYCIDSPSHSQLDLTDESEVKNSLNGGIMMWYFMQPCITGIIIILIC